MITKMTGNIDNPFYIKFDLDNKGYIEINDIYDRIEIINIFVFEEYRKQNIASRLMESLIAYAQENNKINITLEVNINNRIAIHLYKKYQFDATAIRKGYYDGVDGILMERKI